MKALPNGGTAPYTFQWGDGQTTQTATGLSAGDHQVTVTDANGCTLDATLSLDEPSTVNLTTTSTDGNCAGQVGSASVTATGGTPGYTYSWSPSGRNTATANNLSSGTYTVTVTDQNACINTASVEIESEKTLELVTSVVIDDGCDRFGGTIGNATVSPNSGTPPYTYQWNDVKQQTTATAIGLSIGEYVVTVTDALGCTSKDSAVIEQKINIDINVDKKPCESCNDGEITANVTGFGAQPFTYRWNDADEQTTATASGLPPGTYVVIVTDMNGCYNLDSISIGKSTVLSKASWNEPKVNIYPNPNNGHFMIKFDLSIPESEVTIYNSVGALVYKDQIFANKEVDLVDLPSGLYILRLKNERTEGFKKLIIRE